MRMSLTLTVGTCAVAIVMAASAAFARDDESIDRAMQPSARHGAAGSHDGGMAATPNRAPEFVSHAAKDGMAEVALGKIAVERGQNPDVKEFAQHMIDDHSKANQELATLASSKGIQTPKETDPKHRATADRLRKLSGPEFDRAYMQAMVGDHDGAVLIFRGYSERGDDPEIKAWATKTLPTLEEHERMAKETAAKLSSGR